jgi:hypothetical protein
MHHVPLPSLRLTLFLPARIMVLELYTHDPHTIFDPKGQGQTSGASSPTQHTESS